MVAYRTHPTQEAVMSTLVVYYSLSNGNTERIAKMVADALDADIEAIETVEPYPDDYQEVVDQGKREVECGYKPAIETLEFGPEDYDRIVIGTPTWWYTMAPAVATYLSEHDWQGKTVIPFQTHGGWPGEALDDIEGACDGARVEHGMSVQFDSTGGDRMITPLVDVERWIDSLR